MAACNLGGASNIILFGFHSEIKIRYTGLVIPYKTTCSRIGPPYGLRRIQTRHEPVHAARFDRQPCRSTDSLVVSCGSSSGKSDIDGYSEEEKSNGDHIIPSSPQVQSLLATICDTTSIAEFKLNVAGFHLYVKRNLVEKNISSPAPSLPPIQTNIANQTPESNGSATTTSLAISKPKNSSEGIQRILNTAPDEGLVILQSPKVGFFRRSRTIKGKRAPPSCKEKQEVKEGQVLCYIEQLGGEIPIESDVSGEVVKILREDGEPVGYGDALISILPSFPGIKKLQ